MSEFPSEFPWQSNHNDYVFQEFDYVWSMSDAG